MLIATFLANKSFQLNLFSETQSLASVSHFYGSMDSWRHYMETPLTRERLLPPLVILLTLID